MNRILKLLALCALTTGFVSCSQSRLEKMQAVDNVSVSSSYDVLALVGDSIDADYVISYPESYFPPKAMLEVTPVLVYEGGEQTAKTFFYQGEKIKDNYKVVSSKGGVVKESFSFKYAKGVEKSHLELRAVAKIGDKSIELPAMKVVDGCNLTQMLASADGEYDFKADAYQDVIRESTEGQILYDYNSANVKNSQLRSESVKELQAALEVIEADPRYQIKGTKVIAYASPEGGQEYNAKLSDKRAASAQKAWKKVTGGLNADQLEVKSVGQDWEGFQQAVSESNIQDKELILRVLSMYSDPAVRENEIKNMSAVYTEINKNVFPELRRARFIAEVEYQNFSEAELEELSRKAIDVLDEEGILRVAAKSNDAARKAELYKTAVKKFASDRANFNLAVLALNAGKADEAASYLAAVKNSDADVVNAKGVIELQKGNLDAAAKLFAQSGSDEAKSNLATIDILKGDYTAAAKKFDSVDGHNKALAYILAGQLDKASSAITCNCPRSNYLKAIIAARKGKSADYAKYMEVVAKNANLKARAEKDIEFADFR